MALIVGGTEVTSTAAELNIMDGVTSTAAELNIMDGVTSTAAELNIMDGVTSTATELNYCDGVSSAIQTQLDTKAGSFSAGDYLWTSSDGEETHNTTSWTVKKAVRIGTGGTFRVKFDLKRSGHAYTCKGKVTGGATQQNGETAWSTKSEDIVYSAGQLVELMIMVTGGITTVHCRNFRLYISRVQPYAASWEA